MTEAQETMADIARAVERGRAGDPAGARAALELLWDRVGPTGDALHRCSIAHYVADVQESVEDELRWDQRALAAVTDPHDERMRGFLPTLHLNVADAYRRSGDARQAQHHLSEADGLAEGLPADDYGALIRGGIAKVRAALDAESRAPLPA